MRRLPGKRVDVERRSRAPISSSTPTKGCGISQDGSVTTAQSVGPDGESQAFLTNLLTLYANTAYLVNPERRFCRRGQC
ncbi:MAG: hypothetical protein R2856_37000 [Caldilineaceae bacterium]